MRYSYLQIEKYIADKITFLCEKRDISKYRLSQLSGISQSSLGRIMAQENLPSLITLEKICAALGVTLSQFFQEGNSENLTEKQKEVLYIEFHRGFEKICQRIRAKYPDLTIQACASGGGRANYGVLPYFDEFWVSDNTDALQRVYMQWGTF